MREFFERAKTDIQQRKNLELYLILVLLIVLLIADVIGFENESALTEIIIASLTLLIYGLITDRQVQEITNNQLDTIDERLKNIEENVSNGTNISALFLKGYPDLSEEFKSAKSVKVLGISLRRTLMNYLKDFQATATKRVEINIVLSEPTECVLEFQKFRNPRLSKQNLASNIHSAIEDMVNLHNELESLHIRTIPFLAPMSTFIFERFDGSATAYIRFRSFRIYPTEQHTIIVQKDKAPEIFSFYEKQFTTMWEAGRDAAQHSLQPTP
jgi:hypothetical protein